MTPAALPDGRWELTAPESYLLRYAAGGTRGIDAFALGLKDLVMRDALRVEGARVKRRWALGTRSAWLVTEGARFDTVGEPALTPVLALFERARARRGRDRHGVLLEDLRRCGARASREYLRHDVAGSLQRRGLMSMRGKRTAAGRAADEVLDTWLELGKERFPAWAANRADPSLALSYLHGAGAAVLLMELTYPAIAGLAERVQQLHTANDQATTIWLGPELETFASLDRAFGTFDASFGGVGGDGGGF